ncbi:hypothetical protein ACK3YX_20030, partial [Aeromonas caviae]
SGSHYGKYLNFVVLVGVDMTPKWGTPELCGTNWVQYAPSMSAFQLLGLDLVATMRIPNT